MTEWNDIREESPKENCNVLVARDHFGDEAYDYFVATYWEEEDEWQVFITLPKRKKSNYIRISIPVEKGDLWSYIEGVDKDD